MTKSRRELLLFVREDKGWISRFISQQQQGVSNCVHVCVCLELFELFANIILSHPVHSIERNLDKTWLLLSSICGVDARGSRWNKNWSCVIQWTWKSPSSVVNRWKTMKVNSTIGIQSTKSRTFWLSGRLIVIKSSFFLRLRRLFGRCFLQAYVY